ncbi:ABC transporter permease, partial [Rhizobium johnstonii]|uniref:ABC transporter permease n=1 Tax=Rhizobium johnstonii TaxID=3019933 RepID=UPI003F951692
LMYRAASVFAQGLNPSLAEASTTMGASWFMTLRRVTLPLLMPGILAGAFLVFIHSLEHAQRQDGRSGIGEERRYRHIIERL